MRLAAIIAGLSGVALALFLVYRKMSGGQSSSIIDEVSSVAAETPVIGNLFVTQTVKDIAEAIADAEGFGPAGARPTRNNNPGDLKGNYAKIAVSSDAQGFDVYANVNDGWTALYRQVLLYLTNKSGVAGTDSSIYDLSRRYTTTDQDAWANNVASYLGVDINTKLGEIS
jgi:hypothetical protein